MKMALRPVPAFVIALAIILSLLFFLGNPSPDGRERTLNSKVGDEHGQYGSSDNGKDQESGATQRPIPSSDEMEPEIPKDLCFTLEGFNGCGYFAAALSLGEKAEKELGHTGSRRGTAKASDGSVVPPITVQSASYPRGEWYERLPELTKKVEGAEGHRTSPLVYSGCEGEEFRYIGGYDDFKRLMWEKYQV